MGAEVGTVAALGARVGHAVGAAVGTVATVGVLVGGAGRGQFTPAVHSFDV